MNIAKKALVFTSAVAIAAGTSVPGTSVSARTRLSGAGASFPAKIYTRWFKDLATSGGPRVNYQAVGSGSGRKAFIDQTVNFGASDDPMKAADIAKVTRGLVQIPMVGGTIAFGYNYDCDLKLTQEQAVQVAMGMIKNWKEVGCKPGKLTWAHRSDGSGTTDPSERCAQVNLPALQPTSFQFLIIPIATCTACSWVSFKSQS